MGYVGQVITGSAAAVSLAGAVYMGVQAYEAYDDFHDSEAARAAATDVEEHRELNRRVTENGIELVMTGMGALALVGINITSFWGIYETRIKKP